MTVVEPTAEALEAYWQRGAELLHQQCWCWGQDLRRVEGNLLLQYGFERTRPPEGMAGSSRYRLRGPDFDVTLWGFGVAYRREPCGAIYVNRYCFVPRWLPLETPIDGIWRAEAMAATRRPGTRREVRRSRRLLQSLLRWMAGYEKWVLQTAGLSYRQRSLSQWTKTDIPAERMALEWELLARHVEEPPP
jgi:hypothetical protein